MLSFFLVIKTKSHIDRLKSISGQILTVMDTRQQASLSNRCLDTTKHKPVVANLQVKRIEERNLQVVATCALNC